MLPGLALLLGLALGAGSTPSLGEESEGGMVDSPPIQVKMTMTPQEPGLGEAVTLTVQVMAVWIDLPNAEVVFSGSEVSDIATDFGPRNENWWN